ncbi:hypothetical protein HII36_52175 [Nonomuraea sp. NN258]|uniref:hypothetical protein n=1 Tax=Nonomuraea antri TaxID=2730852 RepID=UPI00156A40C4|nr:hypothetical protein [Nonomuraea antri]NRQ40327.1 hypothetical protein [Nonomuraea antri]
MGDMPLRALTRLLRSRRRRSLHQSILRGEFRMDTFHALAHGALADLEQEVRRVTNSSAEESVAAIHTDAVEATKQFLVDADYMLRTPLGNGETSRSRMSAGIAMYVQWRREMDRALTMARAQ